ncbi:putative major facilitator superfamily transporter [Gordonia polyisoprenivorans VH2]|uniref:Putative major facilitator superfamily transporter n=1 Tax=Gordonia polyisoprenivorans (strain DSM 44266 / VH2) TaxID=1112204 RepID=H6N4G8_GORPV|nr:MFS transporter [Gordonia polyisoprenivorans]AFA72437.1 putative major facilitator superfamily transporter [Gordonia polyisoprenivorans VH2]
MSSATLDPRLVVEQHPMRSRQWICVALMVVLNALDGFDVLASAFAAPGIAKDWGIARGELGVILSAELIGMGIGSVVLGGLADRLGRKPAILLCLTVMSVGMFLASTADGVAFLVAVRLITGLGIGGMLAAINAVTAETSSAKGRSIAMSAMVVGYPVGAVIGGLVAQHWLLVAFDWRSVFVFGAIVSAVMIPLVLLLVPETPAYYAARRPDDAVRKINRSLKALQLPLIDALPKRVTAAEKPRVLDLLRKPGLRRTTVLLALGYTFHTITFYYVLKWATQIVADLGYSPAQAAGVLTWANVGGAIGCLIFGIAMRWWDIKIPLALSLILGALLVFAFGMGKDTLLGWQVGALLAGMFTNAAMVGYYSAFARCFPAYARATGTGIALGVGRLGAASSPLLAGLMFQVLGDQSLLQVSGIMGLGSLVALVLLFALPMCDADRAMTDEALPAVDTRSAEPA